ncbi:hypothetical protein HOD96_03455 [Candidatus Falkowbacteria bacterium]|jgi:hypothetical protein|nr:hypothetical protein [Candidatus Falkowbacteria bacterium]MBT4432985.1 hypothetical protein [Candidatus Falkowbacteria bacterium]
MAESKVYIEGTRGEKFGVEHFAQNSTKEALNSVVDNCFFDDFKKVQIVKYHENSLREVVYDDEYIEGQLKQELARFRDITIA